MLNKLKPYQSLEEATYGEAYIYIHYNYMQCFQISNITGRNCHHVSSLRSERSACSCAHWPADGVNSAVMPLLLDIRQCEMTTHFLDCNGRIETINET